jgi:hypothetical protein
MIKGTQIKFTTLFMVIIFSLQTRICFSETVAVLDWWGKTEAELSKALPDAEKSKGYWVLKQWKGWKEVSLFFEKKKLWMIAFNPATSFSEDEAKRTVLNDFGVALPAANEVRTPGLIAYRGMTGAIEIINFQHESNNAERRINGISIFYNAARTKDKIESAFGLKLGDVFNPASATGKHILADGSTAYHFVPQNPLPSLKLYFVLITPTTNRICSIRAIGPAASVQAGKMQQAMLMDLLTRKYGPPEKESASSSRLNAKLINQGTRSVMTLVAGSPDVTLEIRYGDGDLYGLAERERLLTKPTKVNDAGL